jgi:methylmalonyl-CoA/ethylmalonyl-CoA epimerase
MEILGIDHIAIVPKSPKKFINFFINFLGFKLNHIEILISRGLKVLFLIKDNINIEVLISITHNSEVSKFLKLHKSGIHHIAFRTSNIDDGKTLLAKNNIIPKGSQIKMGAHNKKVLFIHPKTIGGILIELCQ